MFTSGNIPAGAVFNGQTQQFSWTPGYDQAGAYENITINVADPAGLSLQKSFNITVNNTNRIPVIESIASVTVDPGQAVSFNATANDPDDEDLQFSASGLPDGASLDASGAFSWTPTAEQAGSHPVTVKVTDGTDTAETSVTINVNAPPAPTPADTTGQ